MEIYKYYGKELNLVLTYEMFDKILARIKESNRRKYSSS